MRHKHALSFHEAVALHREGGLLGDDFEFIARTVVGEYKSTCRYIEQHIGFLAHHAGRELPRRKPVGKSC